MPTLRRWTRWRTLTTRMLARSLGTTKTLHVKRKKAAGKPNDPKCLDIWPVAGYYQNVTRG